MENNRPLGWTTLEEAKMLVDAGLDPNTADMYYYARRRFYGNEYVNTGEWNLCHRCDKEKGYGGDDDFSGEEHFQYLLKTFGASKYDDDDDCFVPCWSLGALKNIVEEEFGKDFSYENGKWTIIVWTNTWGYKHYYFEEIVNCVIWLLENNHIKKSE